MNAAILHLISAINVVVSDDSCPWRTKVEAIRNAANEKDWDNIQEFLSWFETPDSPPASTGV